MSLPGPDHSNSRWLWTLLAWVWWHPTHSSCGTEWKLPTHHLPVCAIVLSVMLYKMLTGNLCYLSYTCFMYFIHSLLESILKSILSRVTGGWITSRHRQGKSQNGEKQPFTVSCTGDMNLHFGLHCVWTVMGNKNTWRKSSDLMKRMCKLNPAGGFKPQSVWERGSLNSNLSCRTFRQDFSLKQWNISKEMDSPEYSVQMVKHQLGLDPFHNQSMIVIWTPNTRSLINLVSFSVTLQKCFLPNLVIF